VFGEFIKERRLNLGLTLRGFCREIGFDASNWSKTERGLLPPPRDEETLTKVAQVLGIKVGSPTWVELKDLAHIDAGRIPKDLLSDAKIVQTLPMFFRSMRGKKAKDLEKLIELLKKK